VKPDWPTKVIHIDPAAKRGTRPASEPLFLRARTRRGDMQVTKLCVANDNGLLPAGRYFARLAEGLRTANERAAPVIDVYEEQERKEECRYRWKTALPAPPDGAPQMDVAFN
jgi:hypothetical protein